ncbi:hypothetical protein vseg_013297 [Gypsophila vaccaria]
MSPTLVRHPSPEFDETGGTAALGEWIHKFGKLFTNVECPDILRVDQAACYLKGRADFWWYDDQDQLKLYHKSGSCDETELFTTVECPDTLRVDQAACYLKGRADFWWYDNQNQLKLFFMEDDCE